MTTVQDKPDVGTMPLLVVRTRVLLMPVEDMLAALIAALIDHPSMAQLRDEQTMPELVLDMKPAADLAEAQAIAKTMVAEHAEVPDRLRVKILAQPSKRYLATQAIGDALYVEGVKCCPFCGESYRSKWCTCDPAAEFAAAWPKDKHGQPLPAIHFDLPGGAR